MSNPSSVREKLARRIAGEIALSDHPGQAIRKWRERFRLPQIELADYLGISPSVISDYESGRRKSPGTSTIKRFVMALLDLDERSGGQVIAAFVRLMDVSPIDLNIVLAIDDFAAPLTINDFFRRLRCTTKAGTELLDREIYGYSVVDLEKSVKELSSEAFLKLFGATTERCLIFTKVNTGRAPMIAIKSQEFKPSAIILHGIKKVDKLALELADQMRIPLAVTDIRSIEDLITSLRSLE
ncbi:MAG: helix-turn-helix domain-containing protein [Candidatus Thorarchaeota archaeon]|nr:MAG: helix-turn-helix domain-containing protein [Candidatus Thorarchaeota archaeon]